MSAYSSKRAQWAFGPSLTFSCKCLGWWVFVRFAVVTGHREFRLLYTQENWASASDKMIWIFSPWEVPKVKFTVNFKSFFLAGNKIVSFIIHEYHKRINFFTSTTILDIYFWKDKYYFLLGNDISTSLYVFFPSVLQKAGKMLAFIFPRLTTSDSRLSRQAVTRKPAEDMQFGSQIA